MFSGSNRSSLKDPRRTRELKPSEHRIVNSTDRPTTTSDIMQIPKIPKTTSSPANPGAPSLLITLPPEIRNMVYEYLFQRDEPILIHNTEAFHMTEPDKADWGEDPVYLRLTNEFYEGFDDEIGQDEEFRYDFHQGIALLLSCRQLYHEAAGVLYSNNTFMISRVLDRHDDCEDYGHDYENYIQVAYAPRWLTSLGSQAALLKDVVIDVDAMCPPTCEWCLWRIDILPLVRLLWASPELRDIVTFGHSGRRLTDHEWEYELEDEGEEQQRPSTDRAILINNVLTSLVVDDALAIQRYAYSNRLLESLYLHKELNGGSVQYKTSHFLPWVEHGFKISGEGRTIAPKPQPQHLLTNLPYATLERVYKYACFNPDGVLIDLDTHTVHGLNIAPFQLNHALRDHSVNRATCMSTITIKMTSTKAVTDFNGFALLQEFCQGYPSKHQHGMLGHVVHTRCSGQPLVISLEHQVPTLTTLSDVRVNIKGMIRLLCNYDLHRKSTVHLTLYCSSTSAPRNEAVIVPVVNLQRGLFLLLSDVFEQGVTRTPRKLTRTTPVPDVWIDGHGRIISASSPALATITSPLSVKFRHSRLKKNEVRVRGYRMINKLQEYHAPSRREYWPRTVWPSTEHLMAAWEDLRSLYWDDWKSGGSREGWEL
jgi:hypothetical protein